jgi:hypothetical protein
MVCASLYKTSDAHWHIACAGSASSSVCASIGFIKVPLRMQQFINNTLVTRKEDALILFSY